MAKDEGKVVRSEEARGMDLRRTALFPGAVLQRLRGTGVPSATIIAAVAAANWILYLITPPARSHAAVPVVVVIALAVSAGMLLRALGSRAVLAALLLQLVATVALVIYLFTVIYYSYGTPRNFGITLSHSDAAYMALGVFSTAGSAPIEARSEFARTLVMAQYAVDIPLDLVIIAVTVGRVAAMRIGSRGGGHPQ